RHKNNAEESEVIEAVQGFHTHDLGFRDDHGLGVIVGHAGKHEIFVLLAYRLRIHQCVGSRFKNWPRPIVPTNSPSRAWTWPRTDTTEALPFCSHPSSRVECASE